VISVRGWTWWLYVPTFRLFTFGGLNSRSAELFSCSARQFLPPYRLYLRPRANCHCFFRVRRGRGRIEQLRCHFCGGNLNGWSFVEMTLCSLCSVGCQHHEYYSRFLQLLFAGKWTKKRSYPQIFWQKTLVSNRDSILTWALIQVSDHGHPHVQRPRPNLECGSR
jgi:hypothetical protein